MSNYVARATVQAELPTGYGDVLDNDTIDDYIERASLRVDELAGVDYPLAYESSTQKFPEITDESNTTPATIEDCAMYLTLVKCFAKLGENNREYKQDDKPAKIYFRELALKTMELIRKGEIDLSISLSSKLYASEKYPDDESDRDAVFTNDAMEKYTYG